jgi:23S rRNA (cytidine1920-2'-O)/16S rRNA (cytidine1409-2'-O)-methyltransferase
MAKQRLDLLLVQRGLTETREQAQRLIIAGQVLVAGHALTKPGHSIDPASDVTVKATSRFVSRGGDKLEAAFTAFPIQVASLVCLDVGASTGGFTDCLLQHGAARVIAVDVGKGQLHWKLRNDPRVTVVEETNARHLPPASIQPVPSFATVDVSFISLTKVLPAIIQVLSERAELVTLIKPQFEAGPENIGRGGVVRDPAVRTATVESVRQFGTEQMGLAWCGLIESPLLGPAGNVEFLAWWRKEPAKGGCE